MYPKKSAVVRFLMLVLFGMLAHAVAPAQADGAVRLAVASGNWSWTSVWSGGLIPQDGDDVAISAGVEVTLDVSTAKLGSVVVGGVLNGGGDTLYIGGAFTGTGAFNPERGIVFFCGDSTQHVAPDFTTYYHLVFSDPSLRCGAKVLDRDLTVLKNFRCDLLLDSAAGVSGTGGLTVYGNFFYRGATADAWTAPVTLRGLLDSLGRHDTVTSFYAASSLADDSAFRFPTVIIDKPDSTYYVTIAKYVGGTDTLFFSGSSADTLFDVRRGTLDVNMGWISLRDTGLSASGLPVLHVAQDGRFRLSAVLPVDSTSVYDSTHTPQIVLDPSSTVEFYSDRLDVIDVSAILPSVQGHTFANLRLSNVIASFRTDTLLVEDTLTIGFGSSVIPAAKGSSITRSKSQTAVIRGAVINQNEGESGSVGAGRTGSGMLSSGSDTWIFERSFDPLFARDRDTCFWSGPSQLGTVIVRDSTVLSVRFFDDRHCDSLDVLDSIVEEGSPCGGHLIGRVYLDQPRELTADHPVENFGNLGLTIVSGSDPWLGRTRIVRTSGYAPPNVSQSDHPVLRYFNVIPENGPQQGTMNRLIFQYHCDELNGADLSVLHFWRSRGRGDAWRFSGRTAFDPQALTFTWDTASVGYPNGSNGFYWMLSEGYQDVPLPVELASFRAEQQSGKIALDWVTASEVQLLGFEITRENRDSTSVVACYTSDTLLRARSKYGSSYRAVDPAPPAGASSYALYEITADGFRNLLAKRTVVYTPSSETSMLYADGALRISGDLPESFEIFDAAGRYIIRKTAWSAGSPVRSLDLRPGVYLVSLFMKDDPQESTAGGGASAVVRARIIVP